MNRGLLALTVVVLALIVPCSRLTYADIDSRAPVAEDEKRELAAVLEHVQQLTMVSTGPNSLPVAVVEQPLLSFGDSARLHSRGTLWAWGKTGRPLAVMEVWRETRTAPVWVHSVTLTSTERVVLKASDSQQWQPNDVPARFTPVEQAPPVSDKRSIRTRQLKDLARRFAAHEKYGNTKTRVELRLLIQPVYRYQDPDHDILDGAVFVLAHDTNPEAVLFLEAIGQKWNHGHWEYSLHRSTNAETHVSLDGEEVWMCEEAGAANIRSDKAYWLFELPFDVIR